MTAWWPFTWTRARRARADAPELAPPFERKELLELYIYQSNLFWRLFAPIGLIELATFTGWYTMWNAGHGVFAGLAVGAGSVVMVMQALLIFRAGQYLASYRTMIEPFFRNDVEPPLLGMSGQRIGLFMPPIFLLMHAALLSVPATDAPLAGSVRHAPDQIRTER